MDTIATAPSERQAEALRAILSIGDMVHAAGDLADLMERAVEAVVTFTGYASCAFFDHDEAAGVLRALSWRGFSAEIMAQARVLPVDGSLTGQAVRSGAVVSTADLAADRRLEPRTRAALEREGFTEVVSVPVLWRGRAIGALNVIRRQPVVLDPVERATLLAIGKTVGLAMANRRHLGEVEAEVRQRRAAERELGLFRFAVEQASDALALVRDDGGVVYANPALLAAIGRESAAGLRLADLAGASGPLADLAAGGPAPAGLAEIVTRDRAGTARIQEVGVSRLTQGGENLWCLLMRDVTAHRRQELELREARDRAQAADRAKSQFLANMSHELRTPLNGILGLSELLIDEQTDPVNADRLRVVHRSGEALLAMIDDVLEFARTESGILVLHPAPFDPAALLREQAGLFGLHLAGGEVELLVEADQSLPPRLVGDAGRIRQVLASLVGNAVKFTERGQVLLAARCLRTEAAWSLELSVSDSGPGIAPGLQAEVFRPFVQADGSDTRRHGGAGLGLAIARGLVEGMGGSVTLDSAPGRGTTVTVVLPVTSAEPAPAPAGRHAAGTDCSRESGLRPCCD
jgi:signal transduction histidine kinase